MHRTCVTRMAGRREVRIASFVVFMFVLTCQYCFAGPIHDAANRGDLALVRQLLDGDPKLVHAQDTDQRTPLHRAARAGYAKVVELLIERGADVNAKAYSDFKPLDLTSNGEVARVLLKAGANPMLATGWRRSSLQQAIESSNIEVINAILDAGYKLDLVSLIELGRIDEAIAMIKSDPDALNFGGGQADLGGNRTPLGMACEIGNLELAKLCLEAGADPDDGTMMPNMGGNATPVTGATWANAPDILRLLFEHGAKATGVGDRMQSLSEYAMEYSNLDVLALLLEHGVLNDVWPPPSWLNDVQAFYTGSAGGDLAAIKALLEEPNAAFDEPTLERMMLLAAFGGHKELLGEIRRHATQMPFLVYVVMGDVDAVRAAIEQSPAIVNMTDAQLNRPALGWAVALRQRGVAQLLLDHGADANALWSRPATNVPLFVDTHKGGWSQMPESSLALAAWNRDPDMCRMLIKHGARGDGPGGRGWTLLQIAVAHHDMEMTRLLLDAGANPDAPVSFNSPRLFGREVPTEMRELLFSYSRAAGSASETGEIPFKDLVGPKPPGFSGAKVGDKVIDLYTACALGDVGYVRNVIAQFPSLMDAPLDRRTHDDFPLVVACAHGQLDVVRLLLDSGAKLDYDWWIDAPIIAAAESGNLDLVELLLSRGVDLHASSYAGNALHRAAEYGRIEMMEFLVNQGFDVNSEADGGGGTPLDDAVRWNQLDAIDWLLRHGADVNHQAPTSGSTPLHAAAYHGAAPAAARLLAAGADPTIRNHQGLTAFDLALWGAGSDSAQDIKGKSQIAQLLKPFQTIRN